MENKDKEIKEEVRKNEKKLFTQMLCGILILSIFVGAGTVIQHKEKQKKNENQETQTTEDVIAEKYDINTSDFSSITPKSEYIFMDYNGIKEGEEEGDSTMHYSVIIDTTNDMIYFATPGCSEDNMEQDSIMSLIYMSTGDTRKTSDTIHEVIEYDSTVYPIVAQTKYYKLIKLNDTTYCDVYSGVIYIKDINTGTIAPTFTDDGTLYNYDTYVKENQ